MRFAHSVRLSRIGRVTRLDLSIIIFIAVALLFGGAGTSYPLVQLLIDVMALALCGRCVFRQAFVANVGFRAMIGIGMAAICLLMCQLLPLPPSIWHNLPARETASAIYAMLGWNGAWHAASLSPDGTVRALLALVPPIAAFLGVASLRADRRRLLLQVVVACAIGGALLGIVQVTAGPDAAPMLFDSAHRGSGTGLFVNRNHQALFLLVSIVLAAIPGVAPAIGPASKRHRGSLWATRGIVFGVITILTLGVLATTSRTAAILLPLAIAASAAILIGRSTATRWFLGITVGYAIVGGLLFQTAIVRETFARFGSASDDLRFQYWDNSLYAIRQSMPWGTGFGSFDDIYRTVEPLGQVSRRFVNHAHNDYLELALEGGVPALLLLGAGLLVILYLLRQGWRTAAGSQQRSSIAAAGMGVLMILLFSVVDYPLRMTAIATLLAMLLSLATPPSPRSPGTSLSLASRLSIGALIGGLGLLSGATALSTAFVQAGSGRAATLVAPWSSDAWAALATQEQVSLHPAEALASARRALRIAPMNAAAVRAAGLNAIATGDRARGEAMLQMSAALGWRDTPSQVWLVQRALETGNLDIAAQRIDGLLRRGQLDAILLLQLRQMYRYPQGRQAIVDRLVAGAPWRQGFLNAIAQDVPAMVPETLATIDALRRAGLPVDVKATALMRWRLQDARNMDAAQAIWRASGGKGLLEDGGFENVDAVLPPDGPPFAWRAPPLAGVRVSGAEPGADGSRHALQIISDGYSVGDVLAQTLALTPGAYDMAFAYRSDRAVPPTLNWAIDCLTLVQSIPIELRWSGAGSWMRGRGRFAIPPGCSDPALSLSIHTDSGQAASFQIDNIVLKKIAR